MAVASLFLSIVAGTLLPITLIITYVLSVGENHVEPLLPYISDTGSYPYESCIFNQLVCLTAILYAFSMYLRYVQAKHYHLLCESESELVNRINFPTLVIGVGATMGLHVLANFQERSIPPIHFGGAIVCFILGNVYFILTIILTFEMPEFCSKSIKIFRVCLCTLCTLATITTCIPALIAGYMYEGPYNLIRVEWLPKRNRTKFEWLPEDKGDMVLIYKRMPYRYIFIIPLALGIMMPLSLVGLYLTVYFLDHASAVFPYVGYVGNIPPESCFFSQVFNIASLFVLLTVYVRYRQVLEMLPTLTSPYDTSATDLFVNLFAYIAGIITCIGLSLIANFQDCNVIGLHITGICTYYVFGILYFSLQVHISYTLITMTTWYMRTLRLVFTCLCVLLAVITMITTAISHRRFRGNLTQKYYSRWNSEDGGWEHHVASAVCQWLIFFVFSCLFLTFIPEFKNITIEDPETVWSISLAESPDIVESSRDLRETILSLRTTVTDPRKADKSIQ